MPTKSKKTTKSSVNTSGRLFKKSRLYIVMAAIAVVGVILTVASHAANTVAVNMQLIGSVAGPTQIDLSWNAPLSNSDDILYSVYNNGAQFRSVNFMTHLSQAGTSSAYGLTPGSTYTYYVQATSRSTGALIAKSTSVTLTTPAALPPSSNTVAPAGNLSVALPSYNHAFLSWSASSDPSVTGYNVYENGWYEGTVAGTSYDKLIPTNQTSSYYVEAINAANSKSVPSNYVSAFSPTPATTTGIVSGIVSSSIGGGGSAGVTKISATDSAGKPVTSLSNDSPNLSSITASSTGNYKLDLAPGSYTVSFAAKGFVTSKLPVSVISSTTTLNVVLQKH